MARPQLRLVVDNTKRPVETLSHRPEKVVVDLIALGALIFSLGLAATWARQVFLVYFGG
jgi:hypothetical protein